MHLEICCDKLASIYHRILGDWMQMKAEKKRIEYCWLFVQGLQHSSWLLVLCVDKQGYRALRSFLIAQSATGSLITRYRSNRSGEVLSYWGASVCPRGLWTSCCLSVLSTVRLSLSLTKTTTYILLPLAQEVAVINHIGALPLQRMKNLSLSLSHHLTLVKLSESQLTPSAVINDLFLIVCGLLLLTTSASD